MIRFEDYIQLKAFARQDGLMLAALWTASFACITKLSAGLLGNFLALATPFFVGWRVLRFRDRILDGTISFRRSYAFAFFMFIYASLVFALVQWAYFRYLDGGIFASTITDTLRLLTPVYTQNGISAAQITETINLVQMLTPIQWAFMFLMQNVLIGTIVGFPIAAVCRRGKLIKPIKRDNNNFLNPQ